MAKNTISWSDDAITDTLAIRGYLARKFSQREIDKFYSMLVSFEKKVLVFPELYVKSFRNTEYHRAVLSKQLSVFYTFSNGHIRVVAVLDNRMGFSKWP
jgi:plasmid stabilization system protein ParE